MSYLDLVEEFPKNPEITQFEKIIIAARRAKDLHDHGRVSLVENHHTAPYLALQELRDEIIMPTYREEEPLPAIDDDGDDSDDDE